MFLKKLEQKIKKIPLIKNIRNLKKKNTVDKISQPENFAHLADEILTIIGNLNIPIFPMFGTLLTIHRDKKFLFADDFDFAILDSKYFNLDLVRILNNFNFHLKSFSLVENEIIELSFNYKGANIDVFLLTQKKSCLHKCPNFRKEKPKKSFEKNLKLRTYNSYFQVKYPKIELYKNNTLNIWLPKDPESIFEKHYGLDWMIPKESNFIDFNNYVFIEKESKIYYGKEKHLLEKISNCGYLT
ncbi:hypothetical protein [Vibrio algivorus]|uniref:LicD family protein n=1 Tax=Vibrio algivorus TaxID=1667024 RepID=A0A557P5K7_9VIBR|nr:hypothetical protein [Vibrio algivorus]TVO35953.1 hypothetical protein FOF44_10585 [Vibrio algivorus]